MSLWFLIELLDRLCKCKARKTEFSCFTFHFSSSFSKCGCDIFQTRGIKAMKMVETRGAQYIGAWADFLAQSPCWTKVCCVGSRSSASTPLEYH